MQGLRLWPMPVDQAKRKPVRTNLGALVYAQIPAMEVEGPIPVAKVPLQPRPALTLPATLDFRPEPLLQFHKW